MCTRLRDKYRSPMELQTYHNSLSDTQPVQKTPTRAQGRIAKRKLHNDGENDESKRLYCCCLIAALTALHVRLFHCMYNECKNI